MYRLEQLQNLTFGERGWTSNSAVRLRDLVERDCYQKVRVSRQKLNKKSHDVLYRLTQSPTRVLWPNHWEITLDCNALKQCVYSRTARHYQNSSLTIHTAEKFFMLGHLFEKFSCWLCKHCKYQNIIFISSLSLSAWVSVSVKHASLNNYSHRWLTQSNLNTGLK